MPIFQERPLQPEADIYALNEFGELVIFELKRSTAGHDAALQALRYSQAAGQWSYSTLEEMYRKYYPKSELSLTRAHQAEFGLEHELHPRQMNRKQHLIVIGSAADDALIQSVDYWKKQGISIDFLPYRVFQIGGDHYFEFFAKPYDRHTNPSDTKGVIFDTNLSYNSESIWDMVENNCVAAYGEAKRFIEFLSVGDTVFLSHKGTGVIGAGRVKKGDVKSPDSDTKYRDLEFLTAKPKRKSQIAAMSFARVSEILGHGFYWARTIKVPYLTKEESEILLEELQKVLGKPQ